jgi:hypothetical protein
VLGVAPGMPAIDPQEIADAGAGERQFAVPAAAANLVCGPLAVIVASGHVAGPNQCRDPQRLCYSTLILAFRTIGIHLPSSCSHRPSPPLLLDLPSPSLPAQGGEGAGCGGQLARLRFKTAQQSS